MTAQSQRDNRSSESGLARFGLSLANWSERWFPDPLVFALLGIVVVFLAGLCLHESASKLAVQGVKNFWTLVPFTMQMVMIIIGGYVVATTPLVNRLIVALARVPKTGARCGRADCAVLDADLADLVGAEPHLQWTADPRDGETRERHGLPCGGSGFVPRIGCDLGAGAFVLGGHADGDQSSIPPALFAVSGLIPLRQTLFLWQSMTMAAVLVVVSVMVAYLSAPSAENARTAEDFGITVEFDHDLPSRAPSRASGWSIVPLLTIFVGALMVWYLIDFFRTSPQGALAALDLNTYNLMFITVGLLLHWRPRNFVRAVADAVPATGGVLIQFPFYAVIFGMIVGTGISAWLADLFARVTTHGTYPLLVALYSAILGTFVPSGGSKWIIEAPYVLQAANLHQVHLGWVVQIYNAAEALPNLVNPFWMLPLLGILRLKARDLVGYTVLQMFVHIPIVFFLCWLFARYMAYVPPIR